MIRAVHQPPEPAVAKAHQAREGKCLSFQLGRVVAQTNTGGGQTYMGVVVDAVNEAANLRAGEVEPTPSFQVTLNTLHRTKPFTLGHAALIST